MVRPLIVTTLWCDLITINSHSGAGKNNEKVPAAEKVLCFVVSYSGQIIIRTVTSINIIKTPKSMQEGYQVSELLNSPDF